MAGTAVVVMVLAGIPDLSGAPQNQLSDGWSTWGGNPERTGSKGSIEGPGTGELIWKFDTPHNVNRPPAFANSLLYLGVAGWNEGGGVHAIDARNGELEWQSTPGPIPSYPLVSNNTVVIGTYEENRSVGRIIAYEALSGKVKWQRNIDGMGGVHLIDSGVVYASEGPPNTFFGTIYALDLETGDVRWSMETVMPGNIYITDGLILMGLAHGVLVALDETSLDKVWEYEFSGETPSVRFAISDSVIVSYSGYQVVALDLPTGQELWKIDANGSMSLEHPVIIKDKAIIASNPLAIVDLNTGNILRKIDAGAPLGMAVNGQTAYVSTYDHDLQSPYDADAWRVKAVDLQTGETHWSYPLPYTYTYPVVMDGILYQPFLNSSVGEHDEPGGIVALDVGYLAAVERGEVPGISGGGKEDFAIPMAGVTFLAGFILLVALIGQRRRKQ